MKNNTVVDIIKEHLEVGANIIATELEQNGDLDVIIMLGNSGAGITSFCNYIIGNQIKSIRVSNDFKIEIEASDKLLEVNHNAVKDYRLPIKFETENMIFWDLPGFGSSINLWQDVLNSFFIRNICAISKKTKIATVIQEEAFSDKGEGFIEFLDIMNQLLGNSTQHNNFIFIISKSTLASADDFKNFLVDFKAQELTLNDGFIDALIEQAKTEKIIFFPKPTSEDYKIQNQERDKFFELIKSNVYIHDPNLALSRLTHNHISELVAVAVNVIQEEFESMNYEKKIKEYYKKNSDQQIDDISVKVQCLAKISNMQMLMEFMQSSDCIKLSKASIQNLEHMKFFEQILPNKINYFIYGCSNKLQYIFRESMNTIASKHAIESENKVQQLIAKVAQPDKAALHDNVCDPKAKTQHISDATHYIHGTTQNLAEQQHHNKHKYDSKVMEIQKQQHMHTQAQQRLPDYNHYMQQQLYAQNYHQHQQHYGVDDREIAHLLVNRQYTNVVQTLVSNVGHITNSNLATIFQHFRDTKDEKSALNFYIDLFNYGFPYAQAYVDFIAIHNDWSFWFKRTSSDTLENIINIANQQLQSKKLYTTGKGDIYKLQNIIKDAQSSCSTFCITSIKYDNPLLNHNDLLQKFVNLYGNKKTLDLLDLVNKINADDNGALNETLNNSDAFDTLELLMGVGNYNN